MNPEIAEQLLYESEATLRLVDALLDELQEVEPQLGGGPAGMHALQLERELSLEDFAELPDLLISAATQAGAVLEALARSRGVLERSSHAGLPAALEEQRETQSALDLRGGLERALLLADRLDAQNEPSPVRELLRDEILELLEGVRAQEIIEQQLSYASSVLRETELQLSALVQRLSPRRTDEVIPFPTGWIEG